MFHGKAAGHAVGVQNLRPFGDQGQAGIALLPGDLALPQVALMRSNRPSWTTSRRSKARAAAGRVTSSSVGPRPPVMMINCEPAQGLVQDFPDQRGLIAHRGDARHPQPGLEQPPGRVTGIAVSHLPGNQLRAGGNDFAVHHSSSQLSVVSGQ